MRFWEFQSIKEKDSLNEDAVMAKIEQSGQIVRILKKQHIVPFSDEKNWLLIDTDPAKGNNGIGIKWIPANTRFAWVRPYRDTAEQDMAKEGYGDHPSQRVDPRTGKKYVPPKSPLKPSVAENFADGRVKGKSSPGRVKRSGASCDGSVSDLRSKAKDASGERAKMYHWCANMKRGRADKSLNEENIIHLRDFNVTISLHAVDQADNRNINIRHIDDILKNISKVKSSIMGLSLGSQFILHNGKGTSLGVRKLDGNKLLLATVYNTPAGFVKGKHSTFKVDTSEITQIPEGSEKFNDEVMRPGFRWSEEINGITYLVRTRWDNMPEVMARVNNREVGRATFIDHQTRTGLESVSTYVSSKWQGHGIAKNMYAVMRMLGANIQPSATQTAMGKDMWTKWKKDGDTKHLTSMNAKMDTQGAP